MSFLPNVPLPWSFLLGWLFHSQPDARGNNRAQSFSKSQAKLHTDQRIKVTFDGVAGLDKLGRATRNRRSFSATQAIHRVGAKITISLVGGASRRQQGVLPEQWLEKAGVPFFNISSSDLWKMFVGGGSRASEGSVLNHHSRTPLYYLHR